jgi:hypothetical protein
MPSFPGRVMRVGQGRPHGVTGRSAGRYLAAACGVLVLAAALITSASAAGAAPWHAFWVSPGGSSANANRSCATAAYSSVQSAVNAAETFESTNPFPVPTVYICPGTYSEQVTILDSVVLTRAPVPEYLGPVTIQLPASVGASQSTGLSTTNCQAHDVANSVQIPQSVIEICAAGPGGTNTSGVSVAISNVTVEGNWPTTTCYDSLYGILVGGGASLSLTGSTVEKIGAYPLNGCQGGVGIQAGRWVISQVGHVRLSDDTIETYQKNGITVDGPGSTADIDHLVVTGAGPTSQIAQNGIQISRGATGSVTHSTVTGNNYTGQGNASSTGIVVFGGCGAPLDDKVTITGNSLSGNDVGIDVGNYNPTCSAAPDTVTDDVACFNVVENSNGYPGGVASADANVTGWSPGPPAIGYQAGVSDTGNRDLICANAVYGAGYAPLDATSSLPNPPPPAFVRPIDVVSFPTTDPTVFGNTYDGRPYIPS